MGKSADPSGAYGSVSLDAPSYQGLPLPTCFPVPALRRIAVAAVLALAAAPLAAQPADLATPQQPYRAPYDPKADDEVLQEVPRKANPVVTEIRALRTKLDADPRNRETAEELARAYIDFGRQLGDAHYVGYAEAVIAPWLAKKPAPASTLVAQATILQYRHQFAPARDLLKQAIAIDARNAQAWLTLATLDMVQGDYPAATRDCQEVARVATPIVAAACAASLQSYTGQARESLRTLAVVGMRVRGLSPAIASWIDGLVAESAERVGDWTLAEAEYRKALGNAPDDNFLLVAYADFLLDRGRPQEVLKLLAPYAQSDTAFLRLVLAQKALKSPDLQRYVWVMSARFEALAQRGDDLFGREQVRFALHAQGDPKSALELAQQNWKVQRAPWDARVFLEAALAANQPRAALPVLDFIDRTRLEDPIIAPIAAELRARIAKPVEGTAR